MKNQMWKLGLYLLVFLAIVLAVSSCGEFDNPLIRLNEEFYLSMGQRAFIDGENLEVKFKEVIEDSRCPKGVTCVWAGRVTCVVELTQAGVSNQMSLTEPGLADEYSRERYEGYELAFHVTPYPEAGKKIPADKYRLHLTISKLSEPTKIIGSIIAEPFAFEGRDITIIGYYRGWDLLREANTSPPVTRSDWVIKDATGAIYISANSEAEVPEELHPGSLQDTSIILEVKGIVRITKLGQPYIEAISIERVP
jgi:hypothetical protein